MNQQIKEKRKQALRTCIHQPFEYNFKSLDQFKSIELAKTIINLTKDEELQNLFFIKVGIRGAIRKLRTKKYNIITIILILDSSITEMLVQAATVFTKYEQQIIIAREDTRIQLQKSMKINRLNCIYLYTEKPIIEYQENIQVKLNNISNQINTFVNECTCEIPIILGEELKYQTVKLKVPIEQEILRKNNINNDNEKKNNQSQKKIKQSVDQKQ